MTRSASISSSSSCLCVRLCGCVGVRVCRMRQGVCASGLVLGALWLQCLGRGIAATPHPQGQACFTWTDISCRFVGLGGTMKRATEREGYCRCKSCRTCRCRLRVARRAGLKERGAGVPHICGEQGGRSGQSNQAAAICDGVARCGGERAKSSAAPQVAPHQDHLVKRSG